MHIKIFLFALNAFLLTKIYIYLQNVLFIFKNHFFFEQIYL